MLPPHTTTGTVTPSPPTNLKRDHPIKGYRTPLMISYVDHGQLGPVTPRVTRSWRPIIRRPHTCLSGGVSPRRPGDIAVRNVTVSLHTKMITLHELMVGYQTSWNTISRCKGKWVQVSLKLFCRNRWPNVTWFAVGAPLTAGADERP